MVLASHKEPWVHVWKEQMMTASVPIIRQQGEGEQRWFAGGGLFTMKAMAHETGGRFMVLEDHVVRGKATPLHMHPEQDEALWVLEGEIIVHVDGAEHRIGEGGFFYAPRKVPHAFLVTSETGRLLALMTPGSGWDFYEAASDPSTSGNDASRPPDLERLRAAAAASPSIELLGPPPFVALSPTAT
jgi:quercetin dioxygenase-like cupin family protein